MEYYGNDAGYYENDAGYYEVEAVNCEVGAHYNEVKTNYHEGAARIEVNYYEVYVFSSYILKNVQRLSGMRKYKFFVLFFSFT